MGRPSRVALVVQRYGPEVNGGAEQLARRVARLLAGDVDLTVLTTTALDYRTWANHFPAGEQDVEGVRVVRFPVARERDGAAFDALCAARLRRARRTPSSRGAGWTPRGPTRPGCSSTCATRAAATTRSPSSPTSTARPPTASASCATGRCWRRRCTTSRRRGWRSSRRCSTRRAPSSSPTEEERELARERFGVGDDAPSWPGWGLDPAAAVRPGPHGAPLGVDAPVRALRRADRPLEGRRRPGGAPRPLPARRARRARPGAGRRRRRAPARPPLAAPAGLRGGAGQARRARRRGRRRAAVALREPVARAARGVGPRAPDACERRLAGAGGPVAPLGRRPLVPRRRRVRRDARPAGARAAPGRRDRPPGAALDSPRRAAGTACARSGSTRWRSPRPRSSWAVRDGAVLSIYCLGLLLCALAGVALAGLLDHRGRWVGFATLPLGLLRPGHPALPAGRAHAPDPGRRRRARRSSSLALAIAVALRLRRRRPRAAALASRRRRAPPDLEGGRGLSAAAVAGP